MENIIWDFVTLLTNMVLVTFVVSPTVFGWMIWKKLDKKGNPKIKMLEAADQEIVEGTNEALDSILNRMDDIDKKIEEFASARTEVKGFRK
tara:strand:+ start:908 stop:1180 length:273 start_codon:yes stop_codon:yes gene_type:complete